MFNKFYDALYVQMLNVLCIAASTNVDPVKMLSSAMAEISKIISLLRE